jgi:hypothetical protein
MLFFLAARIAEAQPISHVIHISIDGLWPEVITTLGPTRLSSF